ncbi:MAG: sodium/proline symporter PutP [Peptococcaceae bacterium]|nr:sodium/proline symporter PutP [Peptococcaceae bacterium]
MQSTSAAVFLVYILGMILIGALLYQRNKSMDDYFLGGRSLNGYVAALSAEASDMSGWLLLGLPGAAYAGGINAMWIGVGLAIGTYLNWQFVSQRLRRYTETVNAITLSDYFEYRFHDKTRSLRIISAILSLTFFLFYTSSGLVAGGKLFETTFGFDYSTALYVGAAVIITYTFLGGFLAVSWTDFVQGTLMFFALILVPVLIISDVGGLGQFWQRLAGVNPDLLDAMKTVNYDLAEGIKWISGSSITLLGIISLAAWGLGYFGQPHILVRFMGIKSHRELPKAQFIGVTWVVITLISAVFVGIAGIIAVEQPLADPETVFITLVEMLFNPWVAGLFLVAILAAIMSTIDSQLLVSSSALAEDFYRSLIRPQASDKELMWISRGSVILIAVIALILAQSGGSVLSLVAYAWAGLGATFGPTIILSLFWKRMTRNGALAGMLVGGLTVIIWKNFLSYTGLYEIVPAFILSVIAIIIFSLLDKQPSEAVKREFDISTGTSR